MSPSCTPLPTTRRRRRPRSVFRPGGHVGTAPRWASLAWSARGHTALGQDQPATLPAPAPPPPRPATQARPLAWGSRHTAILIAAFHPVSQEKHVSRRGRWKMAADLWSMEIPKPHVSPLRLPTAPPGPPSDAPLELTWQPVKHRGGGSQTSPGPPGRNQAGAGGRSSTSPCDKQTNGQEVSDPARL